MTAAGQLPRISIVTPSYNHAPFLRETLASVLDQAYPNLEYVVIDGGSADGSADIIRQHADRLAYWASEPDGGQYDAINKGFAHCTGDIMGWLNSDDKYCPWTFQTVAKIFQEVPQVHWLTSATHLVWDERGGLLTTIYSSLHARAWFYRGWTLQNHKGFKGWIQQEATFWRRELWEKAGGRVDASLQYAGDYELWARFWQHADLTTTLSPLGGFRVHAVQKTERMGEYYAEAEQVLARYRDQTLRHPVLLWLAQQLFKRTGRGGRRFGSRQTHVEFNWQSHRFQLAHRYCI